MSDVLYSRKGRLAGLLGAAALLAAFAPGGASAGDRAGVLQCRLSGNPPTILIENQALDCVFQDDDEGVAPVHYVGTLTKVGANISVNGPSELVWGVVAATGHVGPGALAGAYAGPSTTVKVGVGGGGAFLVGGNNNTVSLQPLEAEAGTGLGVTAGVESLTLAFAPDIPPPPIRRRRLIAK
ncbi:MAG TPA: DUF992 domain-containing protein [Methylocystis sp.]|nr:DUF992 domain-containing protein [Methylocystis sp.]